MDQLSISNAIGAGLNVLLKFGGPIRDWFEGLTPRKKVEVVAGAAIAVGAGNLFLGAGNWFQAVGSLIDVLAGAAIARIPPVGA